MNIKTITNITSGSGKPWKQQYDINSIQFLNIVSWNTDIPLPSLLTYSQAIVTKNRVYLLGGWNGANSVSTVYTASINSDGTLGTWITDTPLPSPLSSSQVIVIKNKIYLLGGYKSSNGGISTIYIGTVENIN